jgi:hypothetical protein
MSIIYTKYNITMSDNIHLGKVLYLGFRMGPFILVAYFLLQSLLSLDIRGIIYLAGLLITCFLVVMGDKMWPASAGDDTPGPTSTPNPKCNVITLNNGSVLSKIPLSMTVYAFTFFYLMIFVLNLGSSDPRGVISGPAMKAVDTNAAVQRHWPIFVLFPILMIAEAAWLAMNDCVPRWELRVTAGALIGGIVGVCWAIMVTSIGKPELQMFQAGNNEVCRQPTKQKFRCKVANLNPS